MKEKFTPIALVNAVPLLGCATTIASVFAVSKDTAVRTKVWNDTTIVSLSVVSKDTIARTKAWNDTKVGIVAQTLWLVLILLLS